MVETPEMRMPQATITTVVRQSAVDVRVPQTTAMAVYNVPADAINVTYLGINHVRSQLAETIRLTQETVMVVYRGLIENPKLIAWWYTLDGHDYYVLKLGTSGKTLVYDLTTEQWSWWASPQSSRLRASVGMNWRSSYAIPGLFGTNVILGDDSYGVLWVLDPNKATDDSLIGSDSQAFDRQATGQMVVRGHKTMPVFSVQLNASFGNPGTETNSIKLSYSDDAGKTYVDADVIQATTEGDYAQYVEWRGLGVARQPGRLFKITDEGALARIDSMSVNDGSE